MISRDARDELAESAAQYIKKEHKKPFFMIVSLINPHDICHKAIRTFAETEEEKRIVENAHIECATLNLALKIPDGISREEFFR